MKTLKLLNKKNFLIIFFILIVTTISAEEKPIDIWNIDKKEIDNNSTTQNTEEKETLFVKRKILRIFWGANFLTIEKLKIKNKNK